MSKITKKTKDTPKRRWTKYSKKRPPFFVGDLVELDPAYHHHSQKGKMGIVIDVEYKETEWFVKIQCQDGSEVITYFGYVKLLSSAVD